jgi:hypothetical protein
MKLYEHKRHFNVHDLKLTPIKNEFIFKLTVIPTNISVETKLGMTSISVGTTIYHIYKSHDYSTNIQVNMKQ